MKQGKVLLAVLGMVTLSTAFFYPAQAQQAASISAKQTHDSELLYVVYLSRHGVRSPTGKAAQYNQYSTGVWPDWPVEPGLLTAHGFHLMELFGAYDRQQLAAAGLLSAAGCADANRVTIYADSDQRTRETGRALSAGLLPGCGLPVESRPEGENDPIFHALGDPAVKTDPARALAAVAGRIGGKAANLTTAYQTELAKLDHILATCGTPVEGKKRASLFEVPATLAPGKGDHLVDLKGPLYVASTLAENLLLAYTEGKDASSVGWGCVGHDEIQALMTLHTAATDFTQRTPEIGRAQAANLLDRIRLSMQQAVDGKPTPGALGKPSDRALFLVGHDTNQENIAGLLDLTWIVDGRRDDTPPGGSLVFEVWRSRSTGTNTVRVSYTAQTMDQMREATPLTGTNTPERIPLFLPGCSDSSTACPLPAFLNLLSQAAARKE